MIRTEGLDEKEEMTVRVVRVAAVVVRAAAVVVMVVEMMVLVAAMMRVAAIAGSLRRLCFVGD